MFGPDHDPFFPTTQWTLVDVVKSDDPKKAAEALETICTRYWYPIFAYLRRSGYAKADAEDLTQMLFQRLLGDEALQRVRREKGRLRSFLLAMVGQVISRKNRHENAEKRGGDVMAFSLDEILAEQRYAKELASRDDPERLFHRVWAMELIENVRQTLRQSFERTERSQAWTHLEPYLGWEETTASFAELGRQLGCAETAARVMVHRLRRKFRDLLESEVAKTVAEPADVAAELEWLRGVLRS